MARIPMKRRIPRPPGRRHSSQQTTRSPSRPLSRSGGQSSSKPSSVSSGRSSSRSARHPTLPSCLRLNQPLIPRLAPRSIVRSTLRSGFAVNPLDNRVYYIRRHTYDQLITGGRHHDRGVSNLWINVGIVRVEAGNVRERYQTVLLPLNLRLKESSMQSWSEDFRRALSFFNIRDRLRTANGSLPPETYVMAIEAAIPTFQLASNGYSLSDVRFSRIPEDTVPRRFPIRISTIPRQFPLFLLCRGGNVVFNLTIRFEIPQSSALPPLAPTAPVTNRCQTYSFRVKSDPDGWRNGDAHSGGWH